MSRIGRYEVEAELGRGTMGVVYLARDPRLQRRLAIKTYRLPEGLSDGQKRELQERFLREAQAAACLSHPGIVTVFDSAEDEASGNPFIAMEYIEGRPLRDVLDEAGRLDPQRAFDIAETLAGALRSAHSAGIIHRDLKPGNVLVRSSDGQVKIADFGVARLPTSELTGTGIALGSPAYMSPEQIRGRELDGRSDLFSLAVMLYESLCGVRPFEAEELAALAYAIVHETPIPATKRVDGLPRSIDEFFDRALAKEPVDRFADGDEFAAALRAARAEPVTPAFETTLVQPVVAAPAPAAVSEREHEAKPVEVAPPDAGPPLIAPHDEDDGPPGPGGGYRDGDWDEPRRSRGSRRYVLAVLAVLIVLLGARAIFGGDTYLELHAKSSVREGRLTVTVDGRKVLNRKLEADGKKGMRMLKKTIGMGQESFEKSIGVSPGRHVIVALLESEDNDSEHRQRLVVEVARGERRKVRLSAGGVYGAPLSLKAD